MIHIILILMVTLSVMMTIRMLRQLRMVTSMSQSLELLHHLTLELMELRSLTKIFRDKIYNRIIMQN